MGVALGGTTGLQTVAQPRVGRNPHRRAGAPTWPVAQQMPRRQRSVTGGAGAHTNLRLMN